MSARRTAGRGALQRTYYNSCHSTRGRTTRDTAGRVSRHEAAYPTECLVYGGGGGGDDVTTPAANFDINILTPIPVDSGSGRPSINRPISIQRGAGTNGYGIRRISHDLEGQVVKRGMYPVPTDRIGGGVVQTHFVVDAS